MKERPILFSGPMILAILDGRKAQTRRVVKPQPSQSHWEFIHGYKLQHVVLESVKGCFVRFKHSIPNHAMRDTRHYGQAGIIDCPYGRPRDRLWVKEKHKYYDWTEDGEPFIQYAADESISPRLVDSDEWGEKVGLIWEKLSLPENYNIDNRASDRKWRPSIHMPRWASRITLEITGIRVERLQEISEDDCWSEGIKRSTAVPEYGLADNGDGTSDVVLATEAYRRLWESINGTGSWDENPWVWVVEFKQTA